MRTAIPCVLAASLLISLPAAGQQISLQDLSGGVSFGYIDDPAPDFSDRICPDEHPSSLGVHGSLRLTDLFFISLGASRSTEGGDICDNGLHPPIPEEGPYTESRRVLEDGISGYPVSALDVQLGVHATSESGLVRAGVGPVWFPGKHIMGTKAAAEVVVQIGDLPVGLLIAFDQMWFNIPFTETVFNYQDGQLVDWEITPGHTEEQVRIIRVGLEYPGR
jgi:hypothetical protein